MSDVIAVLLLIVLLVVFYVQIIVERRQPKCVFCGGPAIYERYYLTQKNTNNTVPLCRPCYIRNHKIKDNDEV